MIYIALSGAPVVIHIWKKFNKLELTLVIFVRILNLQITDVNNIFYLHMILFRMINFVTSLHFRSPYCSVQLSFPDVNYIGRQRITILVSNALYVSLSTQGNFESLILHGPFQLSVRYYPSVYISYLWRI